MLALRRRRRPRARRVCVALVAVCLLVAATAGVAGAVRVGGPAPNLNLDGGAGTPVTLTALRGRVVVLDFWASWCAVCTTALPKLDAMAARLKDDGVVVVAVSIDVAREQAERFLAEHVPHPSVTVAYDPGAATMARFGATGMPALFVIDRDGTVKTVEAGYKPERLDALEREVAALAAAPPATAAAQNLQDTPARTR